MIDVLPGVRGPGQPRSWTTGHSSTAQVRHFERLVTVVIVIIASGCSQGVSGACRGLDAGADAHPNGITVRVAVGRLSIQLSSATCDDGAICHYPPTQIRVRTEEVRGSMPRSSITSKARIRTLESGGWRFRPSTGNAWSPNRRHRRPG
jgi:hypothetical protein